MQAKEYLKYFEDNYKQLLSEGLYSRGQRVDRFSGFKIIFESLLFKKSNNFVIVETGCQRQENDWGAGQSSLLFYEFLNFFDGKLISLDNNIFHLNRSKKILRKKFPWSTVPLVQMLGDSVTKLKKIEAPVDLVYLDSYDLDPSNPEPSMAHHLKELGSIKEILRQSIEPLIAIDDNFTDVGKGKYVLDWARKTGQKVLYNGYQTVIQIIN